MQVIIVTILLYELRVGAPGSIYPSNLNSMRVRIGNTSREDLIIEHFL